MKMKTARLAVLGVALVAGISAAVLASRSNPPEKAAAPPPPSTDGVLVAAKELNFGNVVDESDLRWEDWPKDHIPEGLVRKSASPGSVEELQGSIVRAKFPNGRAFAAGPPGQRSSFRLSRHGSFFRQPRGGD
jgi:pilus assembly protein CpaB